MQYTDQINRRTIVSSATYCQSGMLYRQNGTENNWISDLKIYRSQITNELENVFYNEWSWGNCVRPIFEKRKKTLLVQICIQW